MPGRRAGDGAKARVAWARAAKTLEAPARASRDYNVLDPWARTLIGLGRLDEAKEVVKTLGAIGYRHPLFVRITGRLRMPPPPAARVPRHAGPARPSPAAERSSHRVHRRQGQMPPINVTVYVARERPRTIRRRRPDRRAERQRGHRHSLDVRDPGSRPCRSSDCLLTCSRRPRRTIRCPTSRPRTRTGWRGTIPTPSRRSGAAGAVRSTTRGSRTADDRIDSEAAGQSFGRPPRTFPETAVSSLVLAARNGTARR